jgi:hypothetical protein
MLILVIMVLMKRWKSDGVKISGWFVKILALTILVDASSLEDYFKGKSNLYFCRY